MSSYGLEKNLKAIEAANCPSYCDVRGDGQEAQQSLDSSLYHHTSFVFC